MALIPFTGNSLFNFAKGSNVMASGTNQINAKGGSGRVSLRSIASASFPSTTFLSFVLFADNINLKYPKTSARILRDYCVPSGYSFHQASEYDKVYLVGDISDEIALAIVGFGSKTMRLSGTRQEVRDALEVDLLARGHSSK